jgi:ribonucleotide monophosphatase NagD (HAD superfamily)
VFVTNNSTKSRKQYGKKFESLGLDVTEVSAAELTVFFGRPCLQYRYVS